MARDRAFTAGYHAGYMSAFPESFIDRVEAGEWVWAPWYTPHKIMAGLLDAHRLAGNARARDVLVAMADWVAFRVDRLSTEQMQADLETEFGGMNDVLAGLYALTGGSHLLDNRMDRTVARWSEAPRAGRLMLPDTQMRVAAFEEGRDIITYGAPAALFVHTPRVSPTPQTDCDCVMYPMMLMAHSLGLGTRWNGYLAKAASGFRIKGFTALREMLELPDHHDDYAAATLGFPRFRLHSVPQRETRAHWVSG